MKEMQFCTKCGRQLTDGAKFCVVCINKRSEYMFCKKCGQQMAEGASFCTNCGVNLSVSNMAEAQTSTARPPVQPAPIPPTAPAFDPVVSKQKQRRVPIMIAGIAGLCVLAAFAALFFIQVDDVYVAGGIEGKAVYWKNGKVVPLPVEAESSSAKSIYVSGSDVIVAGLEQDIVIPNSTNLNSAKYWKNGNKYAIDAIAPDDTNLYVSDSILYQVASSNFINDYVMYWKNGESITFFRENIATIRSIYVDGSTVYLAGFIDPESLNNWRNSGSANIYKNNANDRQATYWKDGKPIFLSNRPSVANAIFVSDSKVYVAGSSLSSVNNRIIATLWKNGEEIVLSDDTPDESEVNDLFIDGSDIYLAGSKWDSDFSKAVYWKNSKMTTLCDGIARSIFVIDKDVYICGGEVRDGFLYAVYWKNGKMVRLSETSSYANSIVVVKKTLWEYIRGK